MEVFPLSSCLLHILNSSSSVVHLSFKSLFSLVSWKKAMRRARLTNQRLMKLIFHWLRESINEKRISLHTEPIVKYHYKSYFVDTFITDIPSNMMNCTTFICLLLPLLSWMITIQLGNVHYFSHYSLLVIKFVITRSTSLVRLSKRNCISSICSSCALTSTLTGPLERCC